MASINFISKVTKITADWLNQVNQFVFGSASAATLRTLSSAIFSRYRTTGYYANGDGGGGEYYLDTTDTTSADNGGTIFVAADGGRWKLQLVAPIVSVKQFGVKADGVTDDTVRYQAAITATGVAKQILQHTGNIYCGQVYATADDTCWIGESGSKVTLIPGTYASGTWHVTFSGARASTMDIEFFGNQYAMSSVAQGANGLVVTGISPTLTRVKCRQYTGTGYTLYSQNATLVGATTASYRKGMHTDCAFDDNAGLGANTIAASYHGFVDCTFDRNGYGFQKTRQNYADSSHGFIAFGIAIRLRSHHFEFVGCTGRDNGRDGFNVNQGSYAIKFSASLAHGNDDGGMSIASDNTGTGLPGEGEACYDLEYAECEIYNNYSSGLVAYNAAHNITVKACRIYNNHRCAGLITNQSSIYSGIYIASGSTGWVIDSKVYDDRQFRLVTSPASGNTVAANGWVTGTLYYYPRVAFYNAAQAFQGYANLTAEVSGGITITSAAVNGVTIGSITTGWYVTQAVQHNGVFADNNVEALISVDGFGHHKGVDSYSGRKIEATAFAAGSNVILPAERQGATELLSNPTFDSGTGATVSWNYSLTGGGVAAPITTGAFVRSAGGLGLTGGTSNAFGDAVLASGAVAAAAGEFIEFGGWVYGTNRGDASIQLSYNNAAFTSAVDHPGGGWQYLRVGVQTVGGETAIGCRVMALAGTTAYFDSMSLRTIEMHYDERNYNTVSRYLPL